jgi:hypothetical protein
LITERSLYFATARSACSSSYLYVNRNSYDVWKLCCWKEYLGAME